MIRDMNKNIYFLAAILGGKVVDLYITDDRIMVSKFRREHSECDEIEEYSL